MSYRLLKTGVLALMMIAPAAAMAQSSGANSGAAAGAATGAVGGAIVGGPVGAVVGGAAGLVGGAMVGSGLSSDDRVYVRHYVVEHRPPSVTYQDDVRVGEALPEQVTEYPIEGRPELREYRYAVVNDRTVLVEPRSRKVIEVIE